MCPGDPSSDYRIKMYSWRYRKAWFYEDCRLNMDAFTENNNFICTKLNRVLVAVFFGYNQYWLGGFTVLWFYVQEHPTAQPAVVLILKRLRRRGHDLKTHPTDCEKPGIEPATPGLQGIGLSPTPRRLYAKLHRLHFC